MMETRWRRGPQCKSQMRAAIAVHIIVVLAILLGRQTGPLKTVIFWVSLLVVNVHIQVKSNTSEDYSIVKVVKEVKEVGHEKVMFIFMFMVGLGI